MAQWQIRVIKPGYYKVIGDRVQASSNVILVQSAERDKNILIDLGGMGDGQQLLAALKSEGIAPKDIDYVVLTHYHPDHIWNGHLFAGATFVDYDSTFRLDTFKLREKGENFVPLPGIEIVPTPGHTSDCCSVLIDTQDGKVAIVGDLIALRGDLMAGRRPILSYDAELQRRNRVKILRLVKSIVPGHGPMFEVSAEMILEQEKK